METALFEGRGRGVCISLTRNNPDYLLHKVVINDNFSLSQKTLKNPKRHFDFRFRPCDLGSNTDGLTHVAATYNYDIIIDKRRVKDGHSLLHWNLSIRL